MERTPAWSYGFDDAALMPGMQVTDRAGFGTGDNMSIKPAYVTKKMLWMIFAFIIVLIISIALYFHLSPYSKTILMNRVGLAR